MKNTTLILQQLRLLMLNASIVGPDYLSAYIVPSSDAHHNIRRADCDQRLGFVSGFDGSSGTAIITSNAALLWTDARYFNQAEQQIDDNWTLMKDGLEGTPSQSEWLRNNLAAGSRIGIDPTLYSKVEWEVMENALKEGSAQNLTLASVELNLIDTIWGQDRPPRPINPVIELGVQYTGKSIQEKLSQIRQDIVDKGAEALVITEIDEIAWLLNLRGTDLPQAPTFFAFAILTLNDIRFFIEHVKISDTIVENLVAATNGSIQFYSYDDIFSELEHYVGSTTAKIFLSKNCNYRLAKIADRIPHIFGVTPIALRKAIKNSVEIEGMKKALIRESAALCQFYSWLEKEMQNEENVTEVSAATKLLSFKQSKENFVSLSFKTISASGPNGAIVHYFPTTETDRPLSRDEMYLIDAGSHYLDGTTDTTRTFHYGTPTDHQRDCYTRVLKGQIAIATSKFPNKTPGHAIDALARQFLWEVGLDFGHGTGHGVGAYLNVGEGPQSISSKFNPDDPGLQANMVSSNEPGNYEDGNFGIRLENMVHVVNSNFSSGSFLEIEDMTFVPYQHKLLKTELLTIKEIAYLNDYQEKCRQITGGFILENNLGQDVYDWLLKETEPL